MMYRVLPVLLMCAVLGRAADPARDAAAVITELAAALTAGNVQLFLAPFEKPDEQLRASVAALVAQGETQSYVEIVKNEGDGQARTVEATWELRIKREGDATPSTRREARITAKVELRGKRWRIVEFAPVDFFRP